MDKGGDFIKIILYLVVLIKSIYKSSFDMIRESVRTRGHVETETVRCQLQTQIPFYQTLICIGITLTPGTIVSKKNGADIEVLQVCFEDKAPNRLVNQIISKGGR